MNGRKNRNVQEGSRCLKYKKTSSKIRLGRKFIVETRFHRRNKIEKKKKLVYQDDEEVFETITYS